MPGKHFYQVEIDYVVCKQPVIYIYTDGLSERGGSIYIYMVELDGIF